MMIIMTMIMMMGRMYPEHSNQLLVKDQNENWNGSGYHGN